MQTNQTLFVSLLLGSAMTVLAQTDPVGYIRTVAGDGDPSVLSPAAVAVDRAGNLYIAEADNNRVTKWVPGVGLQPFAGNMNAGDSGDEGPAAAATFIAPGGVAVDRAGNVYIADTGNHAVRVVTTDGIIHHFAGSGFQGFDGDGGPAAVESLFFPSGLAVDQAGNIYIADSNNQRVRKVAPDGTISTIAGSGDISSTGDGGPAINAGVPFPSAVAVDNAGNVYVTEPLDHVVRKIKPDGLIETVAGVVDSSGFSGDGGPANQAQLWATGGLALDVSGNLYIADTNNQRIRKVSTNGIVSTIAGSTSSDVLPGGFSGDGGPATSAELNQPAGMTADGQGNLYFADYLNARFRRIKVSGVRTIEFSGYTWTVEASQGKVGPGPNYFSDSTDNVWVDSDGQLHLRITKDAAGWHCAEVLLTRSLGYGTYRFYLNSPVDGFRSERGVRYLHLRPPAGPESPGVRHRVLALGQADEPELPVCHPAGVDPPEPGAFRHAAKSRPKHTQLPLGSRNRELLEHSRILQSACVSAAADRGAYVHQWSADARRRNAALQPLAGPRACSHERRTSGSGDPQVRIRPVTLG